MMHPVRYGRFLLKRWRCRAFARCGSALLSLVCVLLLPNAPTLHAQLWVPPPMLKMFGVPDTSFFVAGWMGAFPDAAFVNGSYMPDSIAAPYIPQIWRWCDSMGIDIIRRHYHWPSTNAWVRILDSTRTRSSQGIILSGMEKELDECGLAVEWVFYPTDSVRFKELPSAFAYRVGGADMGNGGYEREDNPNIAAREQVYDSTNTKANQLILSDITWNYKPNQRHRWHQTFNGRTWGIHADSVTQRVQDILEPIVARDNHPIQTCYLTVKGHLFIGQPASDADTLLKVEVWYEMPKHTSGHAVYYRNFSPDTVFTTSKNDSSIIRTFFITKAQLKSRSLFGLNRDSYRTLTFPFPIYTYRVNDTGALRSGPAYPGNSSRRINIRVYWTGKEKLALRSIALRDTIANLILPSDSAGVWDMGMAAKRTAYKNRILDHVAHILYGEKLNRRRYESIISVCLNVEQPPQKVACLIEVNKWLRQRFNHEADTLFTAPKFGAPGFQGWSEYPWPRAVSQMDSFAVISPEISVLTRGGWSTKDFIPLPYRHLPSLKEHNGGRFITDYIDSANTAVPVPIPELVIDTTSAAKTLDSIEQYETQIQRYCFGFYTPGGELLKPFSDFCWDMGRSAEASRDSRRRLNSIIFNVGQIAFKRSRIPGRVLDTIVNHYPEAAELRFLITGSLAYGARSIEHQILTSAQNILDRSEMIDGVEYWFGDMPDWGSSGFRLSDTTADQVAAFKFYRVSNTGGYDLSRYYTIQNFYAGWGVRTRETRDMNRWMKRIGPVMMKLNWRDSYSIHYTVPQPYHINNLGWYWWYPPNTVYTTLNGRPLPDSEIVTQVRAYGRRWVGSGAARRDTLIPDAPNRTYVELGLFYPKNSTSDRKLDSHFVFVVNRRCFERPTDIPSNSTRGRMMDSVSEMRRITVRFNPGRSDTAQYPFLHVREVEPDLRPLPLTSTPRNAVDTIVHRDSLVALRLRAGAGTLLEMTYAQPDTALVLGDLAVNNQPKDFFYDSARYHATYWRYDSTSNTHTVFLRTSLPTPTPTGAIRWEPWEDILSVHYIRMGSLLFPLIRYEGRSPSLKWRNDHIRIKTPSTKKARRASSSKKR